MNNLIWIFVVAALGCDGGRVKKPQNANGISDLDIKHTDGSASYCDATKCTVKAGTTVKITFSVNVEANSPISARKWTARIGNSQNKIVFKDWNACVAGGSIVLQEGACTSSSIEAGEHPGYAVVVLAQKPTLGHLIVGNGQYMSEYKDVTIN